MFVLKLDETYKTNKQTETLSEYFLTKASLSTKKMFYKKERNNLEMNASK